VIALLFSHCGFSQTVIKGKVTDMVTGDAVAFANVYLAGTTIGVPTNMDGEFTVEVRLKGIFDLVVSYVGYEKVKLPVIIDVDSVRSFEIKLRPETLALNALVIHGDTTPVRSRDLREFMRVLIGTTKNSSECTLKNPRDVVVRKDKSGRSMTAYARAPIIIENRALGYEVHYDLERFKVDDRGTSFGGTVFFSVLTPANEKERKRWDENREMSYRGSVPHLMKSIFSDHLQAEGWEVRIQYKRFRPSDKYIRDQLKKFRELALKDSIQYYKEMLVMPANQLLRSNPLSGNEIMDTVQHNLMTFRGILTVDFKGENDPRVLRGGSIRYAQSSAVEFQTQPHVLYENGNYSPQGDVMLGGYFVFGERIAEWVPFEFTSVKK
jgi:hypothetical protein